MLDSLTQLAYAIQAKPGGYIALLGSGASRGAGVPTAWEVVEQLIRRLPEAQAGGEITNPAAWYRERYGNEVRFASLLETLAPHPTDRANILESVVGDPSPTEAHQSLARLAKAGYIRIILTTNYDSLMETALYSLDLDPLVIANESTADGVEPLHRLSRPVVVKLHGDYNQPDSMLATDLELASYSDGYTRLLNRTLDDYGLLILGWSGAHDIALREAIQGDRSRRYPLWYVHRENLPDFVLEMQDARDAFTVRASSADQFCSDLEQKVTAIATYGTPRPSTVDALAAELKHLIAQSASPLAIYELVSSEIEHCYNQFNDQDRFPYSLEESTADEYEEKAIRAGRDYLNTTAAAAHLMAIGCAWTGTNYHDIWRRAIERVANLPVIGADQPISHTYLRELRNFPWLLLLYAGSIAAISRGNLDIIRILCREASAHDDFRPHKTSLMAYEPLAYFCCKHDSEKRRLTAMIFSLTGERPDYSEPLLTPVSEALFVTARGPVRHLIPDDEEYAECFDRSELVFNLLAADLESTIHPRGTPLSLIGWPLAGPWPGRYSRRKGNSDLSMIERAEDEMTSGSPFWRSLDKAIFDNSTDRRIAALARIKQMQSDWAGRGFAPSYGN